MSGKGGSGGGANRLCTSVVQLVQSRDRDPQWSSPSEYVARLPRCLDILGLRLVQAALPTTVMTIEPATDVTQNTLLACKEAECAAVGRPTRSALNALEQRETGTRFLGNSLILLGEGFRISAEALPVRVEEQVGPRPGEEELALGAVHLLFDFPKTLLEVCKAYPAGAIRDPSCGEEPCKLVVETERPHGLLKRDFVKLLGLACFAEGGPLEVVAAPTRCKAVLAVSAEVVRAVGESCAAPSLFLYRAPLTNPREHARLFGDRYAPFVRAHYLELCVQADIAPDAIPCVGKPSELRVPRGARVSTLDGMFQGVAANEAYTTEFQAAPLVLLVEKRERLPATDELMQVDGETGCCGEVFLRNNEEPTPFRPAAEPRVDWCAVAGVFQAIVGTAAWMPDRAVDIVVPSGGLAEPYGICGPLRTDGRGPGGEREGFWVKGAEGVVPSTFAASLRPGFYVTAEGLGTALRAAVNPPTLTEEQTLTFQTAEGPRQGKMAPGTFSPEVARKALQEVFRKRDLATGEPVAPGDLFYAEVVLCPRGSLVIRSTDPFFYVDVTANPWMAVFGFDPTGCNPPVVEGAEADAAVWKSSVIAAHPVNARRTSTGASMCVPCVGAQDATGPALQGCYGVRVALRTAGTLSLAVEPCQLPCVLTAHAGRLVLGLRAPTHVTPGSVVRVGGSVGGAADGLHVVRRVELVHGTEWLVHTASAADPATIQGTPARFKPEVGGFGVFVQNLGQSAGHILGFLRDKPCGTCHTADSAVVESQGCFVMVHVDGFDGAVQTIRRTGPGPNDFVPATAVAAVRIGLNERPGRLDYSSPVSAVCPGGSSRLAGQSMDRFKIELRYPDGRLVDFHGADNCLIFALEALV